MNNLSLGFIGVGLMGTSLVNRLSYLNYKIDAYDKNLEKLEPLKKISNIRLNQNVSKISTNTKLKSRSIIYILPTISLSKFIL